MQDSITRLFDDWCAVPELTTKGGEEFLIVSRYTDRREAEILAARALAAVGGTPFMLTSPDETIYRTCSMG